MVSQYALTSAFVLWNNIKNIAKAFASLLIRICNSDGIFGKGKAEYSKYLISRDYKPSKFKNKYFPKYLEVGIQNTSTKSNF